MKLTVKTLNAKVPQTIVLDVELDCKISYVKFLIHDRTDFAFENQTLLADGQVLCDSWRLIDYDFTQDRTIHLLLVDEYRSKFLGDNFKVIVKTLYGKKIELEVRQGELVEDLKVKLREVEGIPTYQQRLVFINKQLEDERLLFSYGVRDGSVIHLVPRLYGGFAPVYDLQFRTLTGKTISMQGRNKTVQDAIERVWKLEGIRAGNELTFNNEPLDNEKKIATVGQDCVEFFPDAYKFKRDSILEFRHKPCRPKDELKVYVKFPGSETRKAFALVVKASHSVRSLKSAIESKAASGRVDDLRLAGEDRELEDSLKLSDYAVQNEAVVHATLKLKLFVKRLDNGAIFRLEVDSCDRIENVKERIHRQERLPTDMQVLSFGTRSLKDDELFDELRFEGKHTPVLGLEVKLVRDLQVCISSRPWPFELRAPGIKRPISLNIKSNETIGSVKPRICNQVNCPPDQQHLYFNGEQLVDSCTFDQLGVPERVSLSFAPRSDAFEISIVPTDQGGIFQVKVDVHDTIKYLKSKIEQRFLYMNTSHFPSDLQILTFEGEQLEDDRTLMNHRIGAGSKLNVTLRVIELEFTVHTEFVEKRVLKVRSDCTWEMLVSEIKKLGLSICLKNDCSSVPRYSKLNDMSSLIAREPLMINQSKYCNKCPGCAKIQAFKLVTGWNRETHSMASLS